MTFTKTILEWYKDNARDLPWRKTSDPYLIWISEVILQQTRIAQGLDFYSRFTERFPSVVELAASDEQEVLKAWQGLGYYSRARNLHLAAKEIIAKHDGIFPDSFEKLLKMKGIGEYTAAAIASISFNKPNPVVDGNVSRFFSRYFGITFPAGSSLGRKKIYDQALFLIDHEQPGMFNQAIMEFGALQCKPVNPECGECLLKKKCTAFLEGKVKQLPVKNKPKKQKIRYFNYFVIIRKKEKGKKFIFLRKREENDVWKNLYDFPMVETATEISDEILFSHPEWKRIINESQFRLIFTSNQYKHILTHQVIFAKFFIIHINGRHKPGSAYLPVPVDDFKKYPVPRLIEEFFNQNRVSF